MIYHQKVEAKAPGTEIKLEDDSAVKLARMF